MFPVLGILSLASENRRQRRSFCLSISDHKSTIIFALPGVWNPYVVLLCTYQTFGGCGPGFWAARSRACDNSAAVRVQDDDIFRCDAVTRWRNARQEIVYDAGNDKIDRQSFPSDIAVGFSYDVMIDKLTDLRARQVPKQRTQAGVYANKSLCNWLHAMFIRCEICACDNNECQI